MSSIAVIKFSEIVRPKVLGEPVNVHVVEATRDPQPDFAEMRRLIESGKEEPESPMTPRDK